MSNLELSIRILSCDKLEAGCDCFIAVVRLDLLVRFVREHFVQEICDGLEQGSEIQATPSLKNLELNPAVGVCHWARFGLLHAPCSMMVSNVLKIHAFAQEL